MTEITPQNVLGLTGTTVDADCITQATAIIELVASVDLSDLDAFDPRDRAWLCRAIGYQAAWLPSQVDIFSRADLTTVAQDGANYAFRDEQSAYLAPLARKALSRVSWARTRTVYVRPGRQSFMGGSRPVLGVVDEDGTGWVPVA